jgi:hypothetical protein
MDGTILYRPIRSGAESEVADRLADVDERMGRKARE